MRSRLRRHAAAGASRIHCSPSLPVDVRALLPGGRERVRERLVHTNVAHMVWSTTCFLAEVLRRVVEMLDKQVSAVRSAPPFGLSAARGNRRARVPRRFPSKTGR